MTEISADLLREEGPVRQLRNKDGQICGNSQEVCVLPIRSHFLDIPNDCLISSYNALLRRNMEMENKIRNAKKEVRVLRMQLDETHKVACRQIW